MVSRIILLAVCMGVLGMVSGRAYYGKKYTKRTRPGVCPGNFGNNNGQTCTDDFDCPKFMKCCHLGFAGTPTCTYVTGGSRPFPRPQPQPFPVDPLPGPRPFPRPQPQPLPVDPFPVPRPFPGLEKPGMCQRNTGVGPCIHSCSNDYECKGDLKCCAIGCGTQCRPPIFNKKY